MNSPSTAGAAANAAKSVYAQNADHPVAGIHVPDAFHPCHMRICPIVTTTAEVAQGSQLRASIGRAGAIGSRSLI
jgi:hypothetical protein